MRSGDSGFTAGQPATAETRHNRLSEVRKAEILPEARRVRAVASWSASSVRRPSVTPNRRMSEWAEAQAAVDAERVAGGALVELGRADDDVGGFA